MANIEGQVVSDGEVQVVAFKLRNEESTSSMNMRPKSSNLFCIFW